MRAAAIAVGCAVAAAACAYTPPAGTHYPDDVALLAGDTLRGVVSVVGADPATFLTLAPAGGGRAVTLTGEAAQLLRSVSGAEVLVAGAAAQSGFVVASFVVRRVDGQDVYDGTVVGSGAGAAVMTDAGRIEYPEAPPDLVALAGQRVWITPPVAGRAPSFGVIR